MLKLSGKIVHKGIALGPVAVWKKQARQPEKKKAEDPQAEILRLQKAGEHAQARLQMLYHKALEEVGEAGAAIFEAQRMLLRDEGYLDFIHQMIRTEKVSAEYAVAAAGENFSQMFMNMDDEYMRDRAADMREISEHLISSLTGSVREDYNFDEPVILMADDLSPGETICMDRKKILAFVTVHGSVHSHTAILAGMMGVPALAGVPVNPDQIPAGTQAVVDGFQGEVIFDPDEKLCRQVRIEIQRERERE